MSIEFTIALVDQLTAPAKAAQSSVTSLADNLKKATSDLAGYQKQLSLAKSIGDVEGYKKYSAAVSDGKRSVFDLRSALEGVEAPAKQASSGLDSMAEGAASSVLELGPVGIALAALAAAAVVAGGALAAVWKGGEFALQVTEANNAQRSLMAAWAGGPSKGAAMLTTLDGLRDKLGMTRAELVPMAADLLKMGVKSGDVAAQLRTLAGIKAIGGDDLSGKYLAFLKKMEGGAKLGSKALLDLYEASDLKGTMGTGVEDLAKKLKKGTISASDFQKAMQVALDAKSAAALAQKANTLPAIFAKLKEDISDMFDLGSGADGFVSSIKGVTGLFDQSTASGKAMKAAITATFNTVFAVASKVFPYVKGAIFGIVLASLKIYIALKPAIAAIKSLFAGAGGNGTGLTDALSAIGGAIASLIKVVTEFVTGHWSVIKPLLIIGAVAFAAVAAAILLVVGISAAFIAIIVAIPVAIMALLGVLWVFAGEALAALASWVSSGISAAGNFISGLVNGIKSGTGMVVDAISSLGSAAIAAITGKLKTHSPSKVMHQIGGFTAMGFADGVDAHAPAAASAMSDMGTPPSDMGGGGKGGGRGGGGVHIDKVEINITGAGEGAMELTEQAISLAFERIALSQGLTR